MHDVFIVLYILVIVVVGILILLYVVIPLIIRSTIGKTKLCFRSFNIEQIEKNRFFLRAELELSDTGSIPATIVSPFIINIDNVGILIINESIDIGSDSSGSTVVRINSPFIVSDIRGFHNFSRSLIFERNVVWHLKSEASIQPVSHYMVCYSKIPFNKEVELNGLHGLPNVSIDSISFNRSSAHDIIVDVLIKFLNPSIFSIDVGQLYFCLQYNNWSIGYVESCNDNVTIHPGENVIKCSGELQSTSDESYEALSTVIQNFVIGQISKVEVLSGPNVTSYRLLSIGMMGLCLDVVIPPFDKQLIVSLKFDCMSLIPSTSKKEVRFSSTIVIEINSPLGEKSPLNIEMMDLCVYLIYENNPIGILNVYQCLVKQLDRITYQTQIDNKYLILTGTGENYQKFSQSFLNANKIDPINFGIVGVARIVGSFALGPLNIDGIRIDNNVSLVGLDGFKNVRIDSISVDGEEGNTLRLRINATIENAGVTSIQLKNFSLYITEEESGTILGQIPIDILALKPGINVITLNGFIDPLDENDLLVIGKFFSSYLNGETQLVKLIHNRSSKENVSAMDLTISELSIKANLHGIETKLIRQINLVNFGIEFDSIDMNKVYVRGRLSVLFQLPSNVRMIFKVLRTTIQFKMRFNDGPYMSKIILHDLLVEHNQITNEILIHFYKQELIVLNNQSFKEFAADLVLKNNLSITIEGLASAVVQVGIGNLILSNIPIINTLNLVGYNQFDNGLLNIDNIDLTGSISSDGVALQVRIHINNPSSINIINIGRLSFDVCHFQNDISFGLIHIHSFYLRPQKNLTILDAKGIFNITEQNGIIARQFLSRMISGIDNEIELRGILEDNSIGSSIPSLSLAIAGLRVHARVPGLSGEKTLIRQIILQRLTTAKIFDISRGRVKTLLTRIRIRNPFSTPLIIRNICITAHFGYRIDQDLQIGIVNHDIPIIIDSRQQFLTPYLTVTLLGRLSTMIALLRYLLTGTAHISLSGFIDVTIGDDFILNQLPITLTNIITVQEHST